MRAFPPRLLPSGLLLGLLLAGSQRPWPAQAQAGPPPEAYARISTWLPDPQPRQPGEFGTVAGVDVADDQVFVVDRANASIEVLDAQGTPRLRFGAPGTLAGQLNAPTDVAVADGRAYVVDAGNGRVQVFDASSGRFLATWERLGRPHGIAASEAGLVYVSDAEAPRITVLDRAGVLQARWGPDGQGGAPLVAPRGLDLDPVTGELLVADIGANRILRLSAAGALVRSLAPPNESDDYTAFDLASSGDGVYAATSGGISIYERGQLSFRADRPVGLAGIAIGPGEGLVAAQNDAWALSSGVLGYPRRSQLDRAFGAGSTTQFWGDLPVAAGSLDGPRRVAATEDGGAFLADGWPRVQRWLAAGRPGAQARADDAVDLVAAPGGDVYIVSGHGLRRVSDRGDLRWRWELPSFDAWLAAGARAGDGLWVLDSARGRLLRFGPDGRDAQGRPGPAVEIAVDGLLVDIAAAAGSLLLADRASGQLRLLADDGSELARWAAPGQVTRLAASRDGAGWFALTDDGWIWKFDAAGSLRAAWDGAPSGAPVDLDVAPSGVVLVADGLGDRIFGYALAPGLDAPRPPRPGDRCDLLPDKVAAPARVASGEPVEVTLRLSGDCPSEALALDVLLVLDQSGSMEGPKLEAARAAAIDFVAELDYRQVQAGALLFATQIDLAQRLTDDPLALMRAISSASAGGGTNIAGALAEARDELLGRRARPGAAKAIVLLTDGKPEGGFDPIGQARDEARLTREAGVALYTIGLGGDIDRALMREMAGDAARYFEAPGAAELARIYRGIARRLVTASLLETITVIDEIPSNMTYVTDSARPPARWDGRRLTWTLGRTSPAGFELRYQLLPQQVGTWPTNVAAAGDYVDGIGFAGRVIFPVPEVEVYGSRVAYLPALFQRECPEQRSDIVVLIDTSSSMDDRNTADGQSKLEAAVRAARDFLGFLALPADRAAIVGFNGEATQVQGLTGDRAALQAALGRLPRSPGTRIDLGLAAARAELSGPGHDPRNLPVIVLLTDGRPAGGTEAAVQAEVQALRAAGLFVFTIGLGADADGALLIEIAGAPGRYSYAPDQRALSAVYQAIAWSLPCR